VLLYEERAYDFDAVCSKVADKVEMYPEMIELLKRTATATHVGALIVTCGIRHVWERVLANHGLSHVKVIGGGRLSSGYVVTGSVKGDIADRLHGKKVRVVAFGDSPLDIEMFHKADEAYVVVGEKVARSTSMDQVLAKTIDEKGLSALQVVLPNTAECRLDLDTLPKATLDNAKVDFIFRCRSTNRFVHASDKNSAKLLMTPTRDAANRSHVLRKAHERVGFYLATEYLSEIIGLEEVEIKHVQNKPTDGYRFQHEKATLIIPLMRGGEPLAFGVSKAMPAACFAHAKDFSDVDSKNFQGKRTIILVDSVINTGGSIVEFMKPLRERYPNVRVIVVAGVVQADAVVIQAVAGHKVNNKLAELMRRSGVLHSCAA
jgi:uracil phosphoribosyltransferase